MRSCRFTDNVMLGRTSPDTGNPDAVRSDEVAPFGRYRKIPGVLKKARASARMPTAGSRNVAHRWRQVDLVERRASPEGERPVENRVGEENRKDNPPIRAAGQVPCWSIGTRGPSIRTLDSSERWSPSKCRPESSKDARLQARSSIHNGFISGTSVHPVRHARQVSLPRTAACDVHGAPPTRTSA